MFVLASVLLLMAALDENTDLMSYYIWLSIVCLCIKLVLAILIPLLLIVEGRYPQAIALIWMVIVMIVGLEHILIAKMIVNALPSPCEKKTTLSTFKLVMW
ncbi:unnamed protein product [Spodoptera exigua]|nr:unnamed protein product [Spodoptera exigua]